MASLWASIDLVTGFTTVEAQMLLSTMAVLLFRDMCSPSCMGSTGSSLGLGSSAVRRYRGEVEYSHGVDVVDCQDRWLY